MQFQAPITIASALERIESGSYVIPVIQRDFVWKPRQIERLFDSLLREYPIGSFLFWEVSPETLKRYPFYEFSRDIVQSGDNHRKKAKQGQQPSIAILDGQQRLTAFLVGLTGTYLAKAKSKPTAQRLYLDLLRFNSEAGEEDLAYSFRFMTEDEYSSSNTPGSHWFRVQDVLGMESAVSAFAYLKNHGLEAADGAFERLERLRSSVKSVDVINFYLETRDDLGEVLNVFVRLNRSGTALSYPDLLLSAATLGWKKYNAQTEFKSCVTDMNSKGFQFSRDRVLKAGLVLADLDDIKFKATNFKSANALKLEASWTRIKKSLVLSASLLADFGLNAQTLTAENAIIPVAYYLLHTDRNDLYRTSLKSQIDRDNIRKFVVLSLLKSGFWTGAVDQILTTSRDVIKRYGSKHFPLDNLLHALGSIKKPLEFSDAEVSGLVNAKYQQKSTSLILSLLYPVSLKDPHHQDHIVPRARLVESKLKRQGLNQAEIALVMDRRDRLPNLQLLQGHVNVQKSQMAISEFVESLSPAQKRQHFVDMHDLGNVPQDERDFNRFYVARERVMKAKLKSLVS